MVGADHGGTDANGLQRGQQTGLWFDASLGRQEDPLARMRAWALAVSRMFICPGRSYQQLALNQA